MANGLGDVGSKLMSLDFEGARESAMRLAQMGKTIDFKTAVSSVKDLGSTFMTLGKALLTNPLFLIAGLIALLVVAIVKVMDKIGLLKAITQGLGKVFELIMIPINAVIDGLKALTDWLGWTSNAAEDAAEKQAAATKKSADAQEASSKKVIAALDFEIEKIKASGDESEESFEKLLAAEREKRVQLQLTAKERYLEAKAAYEAAVLKGDLDAEEIKDLKEKAIELKATATAARNDIAVGDIQADTDRKNRRDKNADNEEADYKKRVDAAKKFAQDRLNAERLIEDLRISLIEDDTNRELEANYEKYNRLREDALKDTKYTQEEKNKIIAYYNDLEVKAAQKVWEDVFKVQTDAVEKMSTLPAPEVDEDGLNEIVEITGETFSKFDTFRMDFNKRWKEDNQQVISNMTAVAMDGLNRVQGLSDAIFAAKLSKAKKGSAEEEKIARKQFDINKKLQIAQALIQAPQAIMAAYSSGSAIPVIGAITGPLYAAAAAVTTGAQIAKIKNMTFGGGGSVGGVGGGSSSNAMPTGGGATPSFNLIGGGNDANNLSGPQSVQGTAPQPLNVNVSVSETEITSTQQHMAKVKDSATL